MLRSGPEFQPRHVQAIQRQLAKWAPEAELECLSDVPVKGVKWTPLKYDWPEWWCKMEIFRPEIRGDFLLTDLDNVFIGPLGDVLGISTYTTQVGESNALAYMTEEVRARVWEDWMKDPAGHMDKWHPHRTPIKHQFGDGGYVKSLVTAQTHWEEALPGQVVNIAHLGFFKHGQAWSAHLRKIPQNARVILCYRPHRPWRIAWPALRAAGMYDF